MEIPTPALNELPKQCPLCDGPLGSNPLELSPEKTPGSVSCPRCRCVLQSRAVESADTVLVLEPPESLLEETAIGHFAEWVSRSKSPPRVVMDLVNVPFMSSSFLAASVTLHKRAESEGGKLVFCRVPPAIFDVLQITRLDTFFHLAETEADALDSF